MKDSEKENCGCLGVVLFIVIFFFCLISYKIYRAQNEYSLFISDCNERGGEILIMRKAEDICVPRGTILLKQYGGK